MVVQLLPWDVVPESVIPASIDVGTHLIEDSGSVAYVHSQEDITFVITLKVFDVAFNP